MWYDPTLYIEGTIEVTLDLSEMGDITIHDIYTGANQTLTGDTVMVGNAPIFITFQTTNISNPITLHIKESGIAITLYVIIFIVLISSLGLTVVIKRRKNE